MPSHDAHFYPCAVLPSSQIPRACKHHAGQSAPWCMKTIEAWYQLGHPKGSRLTVPPTLQTRNMQEAALQGEPAALLLVFR